MRAPHSILTMDSATTVMASCRPDSSNGVITVTAGQYQISIDTVPEPFACKVTTEMGCYLDQMHARVLPVPTGALGGMTHEICAALCMAANLTAPDDYYGVEYVRYLFCSFIHVPWILSLILDSHRTIKNDCSHRIGVCAGLKQAYAWSHNMPLTSLHHRFFHQP
jgi:hypothetical protein